MDINELFLVILGGNVAATPQEYASVDYPRVSDDIYGRRFTYNVYMTPRGGLVTERVAGAVYLKVSYLGVEAP